MNTDTDNGNITVLGGKLTNQPVEKTANPTPENGSATPERNQEKNQGTDNIKVFGGKPKQEPKQEEEETVKKTETDNKEAQPEKNSKPDSDAKADDGEKPKAFAVDFGDDSKEKENKTPVEEQQETVSMSEESVLQFLKKQFPDAFAEVNGLSELSKKEELPEPVKAFNKFHKETGRGLKDFYNMQKDWSKESPESTIREFYKMTSEGLSDEDIETQLELITVNEDDEFNLSEDEFKRRSLDFKREHAKALKFMQNKSKEFAAPLENAQAQTQHKPMTEEEIAKSYQPYWDARDKSLESYNEIEFSIGIGDVKVPITEDMKKMISERSMTDQSIFQPWIKDGKVDAKEIVENIGWAIPEVRKQLLSQIAAQVNAISLEDFSKKNRNVNLDKIPEKAKERKTGSVQVFGGDTENRMGRPLM